MTITDESKYVIDSLTLEELRAEVLLGNKSRFQGDKADYVLVRFGQLQEDKRDKHRAEDTASEAEKTNIAKEANTIALAAAVSAADATNIARSARKISLIAAIAAIVAAIAAVIAAK